MYIFRNKISYTYLYVQEQNNTIHIIIYIRTAADEATAKQTHFRDYIISRVSTQASNRYGRLNNQYV